MPIYHMPKHSISTWLFLSWSSHWNWPRQWCSCTQCLRDCNGLFVYGGWWRRGGVRSLENWWVEYRLHVCVRCWWSKLVMIDSKWRSSLRPPSHYYYLTLSLYYTLRLCTYNNYSPILLLMARSYRKTNPSHYVPNLYLLSQIIRPLQQLLLPTHLLFLTLSTQQLLLLQITPSLLPRYHRVYYPKANLSISLSLDSALILCIIFR